MFLPLLLVATQTACLLPVVGAAPEEDGQQVALRGSSRPQPPERRLDHQPDLRHASAHLNYVAPVLRPVSWYNQLWPKHSSESTFFATNGHGFGYMGLQQVTDRGMWFQGIAIFSIWDKGCNHLMDYNACPEDQQAQVIECGEHTLCDRFGNEGTGVRSTLRFDEWQLEQTYGFMVQAFEMGPGAVQYHGYFHAPELGGWVLLSKIQVNTGGKPWYLHGQYSFVEQWDTESGEDVRFGRFGESFVEAEGVVADQWTQVRQASFSYTSAANEDTTHNHANVTNGGRQWGLGIGGDLQRGVSSHYPLYVNQAYALPEPLRVFGDLRREGRLPTGCAGGTCPGTWARRMLQEAFSQPYLPYTIAILIALGCFCCACLRCCCQCCGGPCGKPLPKAVVRRAPRYDVGQHGPQPQPRTW